MKRIITLVLILVVTGFIIISSNKPQPKYVRISKNHYKTNPNLDPYWEYIKERLFSGHGEEEYAYKLDHYNETSLPILIRLVSASSQDSLAVNEVMNELRMLIPNRTIDYFSNFAGRSYEDFQLNNYNKDEKLIQGIPFDYLSYSTVLLTFGNLYHTTYSELIQTLLPDGSSIRRTNVPRRKNFFSMPDEVVFNLNETLSDEKRKQYIQYALLRTLCYIHPSVPYDGNENGILSTSNYKPESAQFNEKDKFLLRKLYEDDFIEQFKTYLTKTYSWRYASNFLNKSFTKTIAWTVDICLGLFAFLLLLSLYQSEKIRNTFLNYFIPLVFIMLYYLNFIFIYFLMTDIGSIISIKDIFRASLLTISIALICSLLLWTTEKLWINKINNFVLRLVVKVAFTFIVLNLPVIVLTIINNSYEGLIEAYLATLILTIILAIGRGLLIYLTHISESLVKQKDVELSHLKEVNAQSELKLLQSHINPHFLYNALNSIASLAHDDADKTERMALSLSDLFRYSINKKGNNMSTISEEVTLVENYLEIEKIRFGERLVFELTVDDDVKDERIPMFMLQPLIENAIKHGVSKIGGDAKIRLDIKKDDKGILITVSDNGPEFPKGLVSGHGLQTVYDLLRLSYGDNASLRWENKPKKQIIIEIENTGVVKKT